MGSPPRRTCPKYQGGWPKGLPDRCSNHISWLNVKGQLLKFEVLFNDGVPHSLMMSPIALRRKLISATRIQDFIMLVMIIGMKTDLCVLVHIPSIIDLRNTCRQSLNITACLLGKVYLSVLQRKVQAISVPWIQEEWGLCWHWWTSNQGFTLTNFRGLWVHKYFMNLQQIFDKVTHLVWDA